MVSRVESDDYQTIRKKGRKKEEVKNQQSEQVMRK